MKINKVLVIAAACMLTACGGADDGQSKQAACELETRADDYVQGLEKSGNTFAVALADATPAPPEVGNNQWSFQLTENGVTVTTATVTVKPWMPDHGHGTTPLYLQATPSSDGNVYELETVDLFMPGYWTFTFEIQKDSVSDEVIFQFCLEG